MKKISILIFLSYILLGILSIVFYKERTIFLDLSFHLFYILKDGWFAIQNNRFGAAFTQIFPLTCSKLGLPLVATTQIYSLCFVIYNAVLALICLKLFKQPKFALSILLLNILIVTDTFYWMLSEFSQGLAFMIFTFAYLFFIQQKPKNQPIHHSIYFAFLIIVSFFYPLILIPYLFCILFLLINTPKVNNSAYNYLIPSFIFVFLTTIFKTLFFKAPYETNAMGGISNFITLFPNYFTITSNKFFLINTVKHYYFLPILLVVNITHYIKTKNKYSIILLVSFFFAYLLLVNVTFYKGAEQFYIENFYLPLSLFVILPFVFHVLPTLKPNYQLIILYTLITIRLIDIFTAHNKFTARLDWERNLLAKTDTITHKKLIIPSEKAPLNPLIMTWASSYEFWLLSTIEQGITRSVIIEEKKQEYDWAITNNQALITKWGVFEYKDLPTTYFKFNDTTKYVHY